MKKGIEIGYVFPYMGCMDKDIKQKVKDCIESNNLRGKTLDEIVKLNNINLYVTKLDDIFTDGKEVSGLIRYSKDNGYTIMINEKDSNNRKRFTLAHELGHFFLHKEELTKDPNKETKSSFIIDMKDSILYKMIISDNQNDQIEKEANAFAVELLMEETSVKNARSKTKDTDKMAEIFGVSLIAMSYRLSDLGLVD